MDRYIFNKNITELKEIARELGIRGYTLFTSAEKDILAQLIVNEMLATRKQPAAAKVKSSDIDDLAMAMGKTILTRGKSLPAKEEAKLVRLLEKKIALSDDEEDDDLIMMAKMLEDKLLEDDVKPKARTYKRRQRKSPYQRR